MVAAPAEGRVFCIHRRPQLADCAPSGRIRLDALARWMQDIAFADVEDVGLERVAIWVLRRSRIRVTRASRVFGEHCEVRTFCSGIGRMWAERRTTVVLSGADDAARRWSMRWRCGSISTPSAGFRAPSPKPSSRCTEPRPAGARCSLVCAIRDPSRSSPSRTGTSGTRTPTSPITSTTPPTGSRSRTSCSAHPQELAQIDAELEFRAPAQPGNQADPGQRRAPLDHRARQRRGLRLDRADERGDDLRVELRALQASPGAGGARRTGTGSQTLDSWLKASAG